jgi:hypothetical protein
MLSHFLWVLYKRIDYKKRDVVLAVLKSLWITRRYSKLPVAWHVQGIKCSGCMRKIYIETQFSCDFTLFYSFTYFHLMFQNQNYIFALVLVSEASYVTTYIWVKDFGYTVTWSQILLVFTVITDHCDCNGTCLKEVDRQCC